MPLNLSIKTSIRGAQTNPIDLGSPEFGIDVAAAIALVDGSGIGAASKIFTDTRTVTASTTDSLDLAGSLVDAFGATITFTKIKAIYVHADANNNNNVNVTRPAANGVPLFLAASDGIPVKPGGLLAWVAPDSAGIAVTAGTGDLLDLVNSAGGSSVTYDIVIIGA